MRAQNKDWPRLRWRDAGTREDRQQQRHVADLAGPTALALDDRRLKRLRPKLRNLQLDLAGLGLQRLTC
jgi:hypothetical protein